MVESNKDEDIDFKWRIKRRRGGKNREVQFYESFRFDGVEYTLYDCVYLYKDGEPEPYIGKLIKIWENPDKSRKVKVLWFFRPSEIINYLGDEEPCENELFLASGEGVGLANVNPLEAIAGKCNVVCTSKDKRNPQPSNEELQLADFVFFRTFDVGKFEISDKIDEKIAGVEVKFILNRVGHLDSIDVQKGSAFDKEGKDTKENLLSVAFPSNVVKFEGKGDAKRDDELLNIMENGYTCSERFLGTNKYSHGKTSPNIGVESGRRSKVDNDPSAVVEVKGKMKISRHFGDDNESLKGVKVDSVDPMLKDGPKNDEEKSTIDFGGKRPSSLEFNDASNKKVACKRSIESLREDNGLIVKPPEKLMKCSSGKLPTLSSHQSFCQNDKNNRGETGTTQRAQQADIDRSRWFRELPFEERMQTAYEQGMLVLLRNLDPSYVSAEVEEVIWRGFKEGCSAKMLQQTAVSSPHSGQAFVIFKTKEAAERVIKKLETGCLLLPNGRPLVGCIQSPHFHVKQSTFTGHLVINDPRHQMNREMKDAVSTSHCSQANTIEYDMAMDWCLLQQRWDFIWDKLFKQQGDALRKVKACLKSKTVRT